jgi:broad specificity phosphatase PhoE
VTRIELVRHAKASSRDRWWGRPDRDRPLTDEGQDQARALARQIVREGPVDALYSSPFTRCMDTVAPLADALGTEAVAEDGLAEAPGLPVLDGGDAWVASAWLAGRALAFINRVVSTHDGGRVVACSHGDVIPAVMAALAGRDALDLREVRCPKGGRFSLTFDGTRCVRAVLIEAPEV